MVSAANEVEMKNAKVGGTANIDTWGVRQRNIVSPYLRSSIGSWKLLL